MLKDLADCDLVIESVVEDLDTTIQGVQLAITAYTLVMAAFMLVGAKLGDILGRREGSGERQLSQKTQNPNDHVGGP